MAQHQFHIRYTETQTIKSYKGETTKTRRYHKITDTLEEAIKIFPMEWAGDSKRLSKVRCKMVGELHAWTKDTDGLEREYQVLPYTDWSPEARD